MEPTSVLRLAVQLHGHYGVLFKNFDGTVAGFKFWGLGLLAIVGGQGL